MHTPGQFLRIAHGMQGFHVFVDDLFLVAKVFRREQDLRIVTEFLSCVIVARHSLSPLSLDGFLRFARDCPPRGNAVASQ